MPRKKGSPLSEAELTQRRKAVVNASIARKASGKLGGRPKKIKKKGRPVKKPVNSKHQTIKFPAPEKPLGKLDAVEFNKNLIALTGQVSMGFRNLIDAAKNAPIDEEGSTIPALDTCIRLLAQQADLFDSGVSNMTPAEQVRQAWGDQESAIFEALLSEVFTLGEEKDKDCVDLAKAAAALIKKLKDSQKD